MAINMAKMEEDRGTPTDLRRLEEEVNALIKQTEGAHSYHKTVTRVSLDGKIALDYFDELDVYIIHLPPDSPSLPNNLREVIEESRKVRNGSESEKRDFIRFLEGRIELIEGTATSQVMAKRITFLKEPFIDVYDSGQVHVRVPSTRLPDPFTEIVRLYQREGYGIVGYAPAGGFI